ncbi:hypothetical protein N7454_005345 [Penicillium verhagenii]|nr:hypothetical protein N7454_005345 [Penicillium verhagenii]
MSSTQIRNSAIVKDDVGPQGPVKWDRPHYSEQKGGCLGRKIKCNEERPTCRQCVKAGIKCSWDPSSRLHIQKSRRRRKATAHRTAILESSFSNAGRGEDWCTSESSSTFTGQFQLPVSANIFPEASNHEGSEHDGALLYLHAPNHGTERPPDRAVYNQYCVENGAELETPSLPLSSYIHPPALPCANSILLSRRDRLYLAYFPTCSLVKVLGKAYAWSNFRYMCQDKASEEAIVMYAVMALSAGEMNQSLGLPAAHSEGGLYYRLAMERIEDTVNDLDLNCESGNMEAVLAAIFLVITYSWRFGSSISDFRKHTQCLLKCLDAIFSRFSARESNAQASIDLTTCPMFTPFCAQILLWIL